VVEVVLLVLPLLLVLVKLLLLLAALLHGLVLLLLIVPVLVLPAGEVVTAAQVESMIAAIWVLSHSMPDRLVGSIPLGKGRQQQVSKAASAQDDGNHRVKLRCAWRRETQQPYTTATE
jgi:hypothetical protein